jgi:hypothetical protein
MPEEIEEALNGTVQDFVMSEAPAPASVLRLVVGVFQVFEDFVQMR